MGCETVRATVSAHISRHNSEEDARDDELWQQFLTEVRALAAKYDECGSSGIDVDETW